jgi:kynurenine formamidase
MLFFSTEASAMTPSWIDALLSAHVYDLEQPRHAGMPIYPTHKPGYFYALHRRHRDNYRPEANGPRSGASGTLVMMEHSGTHIDALCHQAYSLKLHGGIPVDEVETTTGFTRLGIEAAPPLLRRGVLLDVAGWKRQSPLPRKYGISGDDFSACARAQGIEVKAGDVLCVRTGYGTFWNDEGEYLRASGVAKTGSLWAAERGVVAVGIDNMSWDVPEERDPETGATLFGHYYLLPQRGIYIIENLYLEELARDRRYEFAFVAIPLKLVGATGSPLRPLALVAV